MSAMPRQIRKKAAKRPAPRMVTVTVDSGDFEGWEATARADFPAGILEDLESGSISRIIAALDVIVVDHNFPDAQDEIATSMGEVDPYTGLMDVAGRIFDAIAKLPNR